MITHEAKKDELKRIAASAVVIVITSIVVAPWFVGVWTILKGVFF